ncbi:hypothetical protein CIB48_g3573 [Xylaria polymorpha]|nr:hypothetical protein CIB48_g3573 [Xylaria polymorpha]
MKTSSAILRTLAVPVAIASAAITGTSTFYGGNLQGGACSFSTYTLPAGVYGTAYSGSAWNSAEKCGACIRVTAGGNSLIAMIVDKCPECDEGHLDLFENAFHTLSPSATGLLATSYDFVECPISSPLILHTKTGVSVWWFSIQVVNATEAVAKLEVSTNGGSTWTSLMRQDYNFFEYSSGFGTNNPTVTVRVTSESGKTVVVKNVSAAPDVQIMAGSNF